MNRFGRKNNSHDKYFGDRTKKKITSHTVDLSEEMFPVLSASASSSASSSSTSSNTASESVTSITRDKPMSKSVWSPQPIKEKLLNQDPMVISEIDVTDSRYWQGIHWTGPIIMRGGTSGSRIEYSRDNIQWHSSWEDTFSEALIEQQHMEKEQRREQEEYEEVYRIMDEYANNIESESERYYNEVGELDDYAKAFLARRQYEEYAKQFDVVDEVEMNENSEVIDEDSNLEEDDY